MLADGHRKHGSRCRLLIAVCGWSLALACGVCARAAEVQFRSQAAVTGHLVTLGDVADITASDPAEAASLRTLELFPAPVSGRPRVVRAREIQDLLALRPLNLAGLQFGGATTVCVNRTEEAGSSGGARPAPPASRQ